MALSLTLTKIPQCLRRCLGSYVQGQTRDKIREYFYFIDHQGMLFMDDARIRNFTSCFKDKKFLHFFYTRVKLNKTGRYEEEFPYISPCGRELNFIRCDDLPVVFTQIKDNNVLIWGNVDELTIPFDPTKLHMSSRGRIYHPYNPKYPYVGLVASKVGIEISNNFIFGSDGKPKMFRWHGEDHLLTNECEVLLSQLRQIDKTI